MSLVVPQEFIVDRHTECERILPMKKKIWMPTTVRKVRRKVADYYDIHINSLPQGLFAEMLGVHRNTVHLWEAGKRVPDNSWQFIFYKINEDPSFIGEVRRIIGNEQTIGTDD